MASASSPETEKTKPLAKAQSRTDMVVLVATALPVIFLINLQEPTTKLVEVQYWEQMQMMTIRSTHRILVLILCLTTCLTVK